MPAGRFQLAFDDPTLEWDATWTTLDDTDNLVASYTIDRGRQYELDQTDTGRATVEISDRDGVLDPTNAGGPYYGKIEPLLQARIRRWNPVSDAWQIRFRGFIEELDYVFDPSQQVNKLVISLVDLFEILSRVEMTTRTAGGAGFGDVPTSTNVGQVKFVTEDVQSRITRILEHALGDTKDDYWVVFTGNVDLYQTIYSPGEGAMTAIQEAADSEFPGVSNVYCDRLGRLCFHGRLAKFDPVGVASEAGPGVWEFHQWLAGDRAAVLATPDTAQIRRFAFNRGLAKIINQAVATPFNIADDDVNGQLVTDTASIDEFGIRSWSSQNLLTKRGLLDDSSALVETKRFAEFYVDNFKQPRNRVTDIAFKSLRPGHAAGTATWDLLCRCDISDSIQVTVDSPGGGGFDSVDYFVEGIHETARPLNPEYDDVELTLDLSPQAYFDNNPWE